MRTSSASKGAERSRGRYRTGHCGATGFVSPFWLLLPGRSPCGTGVVGLTYLAHQPVADLVQLAQRRVYRVRGAAPGTGIRLLAAPRCPATPRGLRRGRGARAARHRRGSLVYTTGPSRGRQTTKTSQRHPNASRRMNPQLGGGSGASAQVGAGPLPVEAHLPHHQPWTHALVLRVKAASQTV